MTDYRYVFFFFFFFFFIILWTEIFVCFSPDIITYYNKSNINILNHDKFYVCDVSKHCNERYTYMCMSCCPIYVLIKISNVSEADWSVLINYIHKS